MKKEAYYSFYDSYLLDYFLCYLEFIPSFFQVPWLLLTSALISQYFVMTLWCNFPRVSSYLSFFFSCCAFYAFFILSVTTKPSNTLLWNPSTSFPGDLPSKACCFPAPGRPRWFLWLLYSWHSGSFLFSQVPCFLYQLDFYDTGLTP